MLSTRYIPSYCDSGSQVAKLFLLHCIYELDSPHYTPNSTPINCFLYTVYTLDSPHCTPNSTLINCFLYIVYMLDSPHCTHNSIPIILITIYKLLLAGIVRQMGYFLLG